MIKGKALQKRCIRGLLILSFGMSLIGCGSKDKVDTQETGLRYENSTPSKAEGKGDYLEEEIGYESPNNNSNDYGESGIVSGNDKDMVSEKMETNQEITTFIGNNEVLYTFLDEESVLEEREFNLHDFEIAALNPISTFSVDVDTASYSMIRSYLKDNRWPYQDDIRIEEMINYFDYDYSKPFSKPFSINTEVGVCPWDDEYLIAKIGLNGKEISLDKRASTNLVFLMDVSGSMNDEDKLPLLKESFKLLVDELSEDDRVSIVVYAGASGTVLEGARGNDSEKIMTAINRLEAGGSTAGSEGIQLAYRLANKYFIKNGNNRVILATDGDFNVGLTSEDDLLEFIEEKREEGIFLSALGFGDDNRNFDTMELLADNGNGHFAYIDSEREARKVLKEELGGTLYTIAKDVKIQVEFNPLVVDEYTLIGYDNRRLKNEDFNDDKVDAGDIGAGHQVTALYLIKLQEIYSLQIGGLRYQERSYTGKENELMYVKLRYKEPNRDESILLTQIVENQVDKEMSSDFGFASTVAEFGLALRGDFNYNQKDYERLYDKAMEYILDSPDTYKIEFVGLISKAADMN